MNSEEMGRNQQINNQQASINAQQAGTGIRQARTNIQQASMGTQVSSISVQHPIMSSQPSMSIQHGSRSHRQTSMSTQQPSMSSQQPSASSQQMNLNSQQINMLNQMNLHGHPITLMGGQPITMNINNQPMSMHSPQIAMGMNPQLMNMNVHAPLSHHMLNMHSPHLNVHAPQLNLLHQPLNMNTHHLNVHPHQIGMTAQQYNIQQMRLHQQLAAQQMNAQQMYMSPQQMSTNTQPTTSTARQTTSEEVLNPQPSPEPIDRDKIYQWILELNDSSTRENALIELCKRREDVSDLAVLLWHGFGTAAALLQEIMSIYAAINPAVLSAAQSNRVCNALALLQCVAAHPETRPLFIAAQFPLFLYPFLHTISKNRPFEYLRLTCLGVIGALVKSDEPEVIQYLLDTEIIPLCLRIMECGSELSKIVATFILQKILASERGLNYICETYERFSHIAMILGKLILTLAANPSARLLKHIVRCYLRLSEHPRAREALRQCIPDQLVDATFSEFLQDEPLTRSWIAELLVNLDIHKPYYDPRQFSRSSTSTTPH